MRYIRLHDFTQVTDLEMMDSAVILKPLNLNSTTVVEMGKKICKANYLSRDDERRKHSVQTEV